MTILVSSSQDVFPEENDVQNRKNVANIPDLSSITHSTPIVTSDIQDSIEIINYLKVPSVPVDLSCNSVTSTNDSQNPDKTKKSVRFSDSIDYDLNKLIHNHMLRTSLKYREDHRHSTITTEKSCRLTKPVMIAIGALCLAVLALVLGIVYWQVVMNSEPVVNHLQSVNSTHVENADYFVGSTESSTLKVLLTDNSVPTTTIRSVVVLEKKMETSLEAIVELLGKPGPLQL